MARRGTPTIVRLIALATATGLTLSLSACAGQDDAEQTSPTPTADAGTVAMFVPSDGLTLSQHTPLNKWAKLTPAVTDALKQAGVDAKNIDVSTSDGLDEQSRDVQDYVVEHASGSDDAQGSDAKEADDGTASKASGTTIVIAPAAQTDAATRQYGDYVSRHIGVDDAHDAAEDESDDASTDGAKTNDADGTDADAASDEAARDSTDAATDTDDAERREAVERLSSALTLAKESGMHVVMLANDVEGVVPDVFVRMSTAETIGATQAMKLVGKLQLAKASRDNPKSIEIMLPYDSESADTSFAQEAFAGAWSVLEPYFKDHRAVSPSGALSADTTAGDWRSVAFDARKTQQVQAVFESRLGYTKGVKSTTRIDGVIAMNDFVASGVAKALADMGYTGSAADINPSITISGIVNNITGRKDLRRSAVPDPAKSPQTDETEVSGGNDADDDATRWPIVTGYGAYLADIPSVVNGKQWMTGLEDRDALATDIAQVSVRLNRGQSLDELSYVGASTVAGRKNVPTVTQDLLSVSASNLKSALIDPGYITPADAGL